MSIGYKETEFGRILNGWEFKKLGEFVTIQRGHDLPESKRRPGNIPVLGSFGITGHHDTAKAKGPGVTIGRSGASFGIVSFTPVDYWPLNTALYVIDFHGNDEKFSYYFLRAIDFSAFNSGSAQPSLNRNFIHPIQIHVPPLPDQRTIAAILSALDDKIELNNQMNKTLEEMAQAIFKSWFIDFEPFQDMEFEDSDLGKIPKGWQVKRFTDFADVLSGGTPKTKEPIYWNGDIPFFTPKDVRDSFYVTKTEKHITELGLNNCNSKLYPANTVFITARGTVGKVVLNSVSMAMNQSCYALQGKNNIQQTFIFLMTKYCVDKIKKSASGAVFDAITVDTFRALKIELPPLQVINEFCNKTLSIFEKISTNMLMNDTLSKLRDLLLPKLMSGEIRVPAGD